MFCSAFFITLHNLRKTTRRSVLALLVEYIDFDPNGHVIPALRRVAAGLRRIVSLVKSVVARHGYPLPQRAADLCVGTLRVHYIGLLLAHAIASRTDRQVYRFTCDAGGDVKTPGDVAVVGLGEQAAVGVGLGAGQRYALAGLDKCRGAFAGLDLLGAAVAAGGADHPGVRIISGQVVVTGIDRDQQAPGGCVELRQQVFEVLDFRGACLDDQLVAIGADFAVFADKVLRDGQQFCTGAVLQGDDAGVGDRAEASDQQQASDEGA